MIGKSLFKTIERLVYSYKRRTFVSFKRPLTQTLDLLKPHTVVEFGPGHSTKLFLKYSNAEIWSFETHKKWFEKYKDEFDSPRVHLIYKEPNWSLKEIETHVKFPSLIFVDGGNRVAALKEAISLIDNHGVVYLHDAHREDYEEGIKLYPYRYFPERHSCILCKDQQLYEAIIDNVASDYSCDCEYCSSDSRRAYFERMSSYS